VVASYTYDAWGNHTVYDEFGDVNTYYGTIGNINPIRYRGYYYDTETRLYLIQGRYYDPEIGRFIEPTTVSSFSPYNRRKDENIRVEI
jgi:RHS repeat-associated protein